jgi:hypothetical protein
MTSPTQRRGEHRARRAATNNNHFSFVGQHYFSFNRLSSSVVRSARARIRLWTVRVVSRASSQMPLPDARAGPSIGDWPVRWPLADATFARRSQNLGGGVRRATARSDCRSKGRRLDEVAIGQKAQGTGQ